MFGNCQVGHPYLVYLPNIHHQSNNPIFFPLEKKNTKLLRSQNLGNKLIVILLLKKLIRATHSKAADSYIHTNEIFKLILTTPLFKPVCQMFCDCFIKIATVQ